MGARGSFFVAAAVIYSVCIQLVPSTCKLVGVHPLNYWYPTDNHVTQEEPLALPPLSLTTIATTRSPIKDGSPRAHPHQHWNFLLAWSYSGFVQAMTVPLNQSIPSYIMSKSQRSTTLLLSHHLLQISTICFCLFFYCFDDT